MDVAKARQMHPGGHEGLLDHVPRVRLIAENGGGGPERRRRKRALARRPARYRMRKVEELTGRDLSRANDRVELWLALRARELIA